MTTQLKRTAVVGYEGIYEVDSDGRLFSLPRTYKDSLGRTGKVRGRERKPVIAGPGYQMLYLTKGACDKKCWTVHRIVAMALLGDPSFCGAQVNHINGEKTDNRLSNLEWVSRSGNMRHSRDVLGHAGAALGRFGSNNPGAVAVEATTSGGIVAHTFAALQDAARAGFSAGCISLCLSGQRAQHKGFRWRRALPNPTSRPTLEACAL